MQQAKAAEFKQFEHTLQKRTVKAAPICPMLESVSWSSLPAISLSLSHSKNVS